ncbi:MAG: hypothetical protein ACPGWR_30225, partial [Ardenticatenaceae bacterium]
YLSSEVGHLSSEVGKTYPRKGNWGELGGTAKPPRPEGTLAGQFLREPKTFQLLTNQAQYLD